MCNENDEPLIDAADAFHEARMKRRAKLRHGLISAGASVMTSDPPSTNSGLALRPPVFGRSIGPREPAASRNGPPG
jgi:hypothetical protein